MESNDRKVLFEPQSNLLLAKLDLPVNYGRDVLFEPFLKKLVLFNFSFLTSLKNEPAREVNPALLHFSVIFLEGYYERELISGIM